MATIDLPADSPTPGGVATPLLRVRGLTKSFVGNVVLRDADLEVHAGEVHGLVGENGAGKSTLMKILAGVHQPDAGTIEIDGERGRASPTRCRPSSAGLSTVFQEFNLLPERTVAENICLGREPRRRGLVDTAAMARDTEELLDRARASPACRPSRRVRSLSVAEQQVVEIAKAVSYDARIISMDEPTAALADHEVELLYAHHRHADRARRRDPLRLAPAQGDLRPLRHDHRAQGRRAGRHRARPPTSTRPASCA